MARLVVATVPLTGHVQPMLALVRALTARGHAVTWTTASKFASAIVDAGARFVPPRHTRDWDDADLEAAFPELRGTRGLGRVKRQLCAMFVTPMLDQLRDLEAIAHGADAVLADAAHLGAGLVAERTGLPWIGLGISALAIPSVDTLPFGSGLRPDLAGARGRRFFNWLVLRVLFGSVNRAYRDARAAAGLPADGMYFEAIARDLFLQPTVPSFEYPRSDLPPQVRFIGPLMSRTLPRGVPVWWSDVEAAQSAGTPIVLVTQGTLATDPRELIEPALRALASEPVLVIATTGRPYTGAVPPNARVAPFVPYSLLLPRVAAMVTNGGYGGVQMALANGVPLVVAGGSEEKPEIAARVAWSGAGIDLRTGRPRPRAIARAVRELLATVRYRDRARELAAEMRAYDGPELGATLIEERLGRGEARRRAS
jgi:MGT family glycosyltransferase